MLCNVCCTKFKKKEKKRKKLILYIFLYHILHIAVKHRQIWKIPRLQRADINFSNWAPSTLSKNKQPSVSLEYRRLHSICCFPESVPNMWPQLWSHKKLKTFPVFTSHNMSEYCRMKQFVCLISVFCPLADSFLVDKLDDHIKDNNSD